MHLKALFKLSIIFFFLNVYSPSLLANNIVPNGSFEEHGILSHGNWGTLNELEGWVAEEGHFEIQLGKTAGIDASDGEAKLELDALFNSTIYTSLETITNQDYLLKFSYSPRIKKKNTNTNDIEVFWGEEKITRLSGDKRGWDEYNFIINASADVSKLTFKAAGKSDSYGGFIDNVQVISLKSLGYNAINNGSFEEHGTLNNGSWGTFTSIPNWTANKGFFEIQSNNVSGINAVDGLVKAELDSTKNSKVYQTLDSLKEGETYQLILNYSPRVKNHKNTNKIKLLWNNKKLDELNGTQKGWKKFFYTVTAESENELQFHASGKSDSYGGLLDDIRLYCLSCENIAPIADAGNDQISTVGDVVIFDATSSNDEDGEIESVEWKENETVLSTDPQFSIADLSIGEHAITLTVTDNQGATATDTVIITVETGVGSNIPPIADSQSVNTQENTLTLITLSASDSDQDELTYSITTSPENGSLSGNAPNLTYIPNTDFFGEDSFDFIVNDGQVNSNAATVTIAVIRAPDTIPPTITLNGGDESIVKGQAYEEKGATATDDRDGAVEVSISGTVDINTVGTYTLTYSATDSTGNSSSATRTVTIIEPIDTTPPEIILNGGDISLNVGDEYVELGATAVDEQDGSIEVSISGDIDTSTAGTYTRTYTASDSALNTTSITRTITVSQLTDTTPPLIRINGSDVTLFVGDIYQELGATATDDQDGEITPTITGNVDTNIAGLYEITYTATDLSGNSSTAVRYITVEVASFESRTRISIKDPQGNTIFGARIDIYKNEELVEEIFNTTKEFTPINVLGDSRYLLKINKEGYATFVTEFKTLASSRILVVSSTLVPHATTLDFSSNTPHEIITDNGAKVSLDANSFQADVVTAKITPIDFTQRGFLSAFPGRFLGSSETGEIKPLVSYGVVDFTFENNGSHESLLDGIETDIEIPLFVNRELNGVDIQEGHYLPVWSLNELNGIWQFETNGLVVASNNSPTGLAVSARVNHFTYFNVGAFEREGDFIEKTVQILDSKYESNFGERGGHQEVLSIAQSNTPAYSLVAESTENFSARTVSQNRVAGGNYSTIRFMKRSQNCGFTITTYYNSDGDAVSVVKGPVKCRDPEPPYIPPTTDPITYDPDPVEKEIDEEEANFDPEISEPLWKIDSSDAIHNIIEGGADNNNIVILGDNLRELNSTGETLWSSEAFPVSPGSFSLARGSKTKLRKDSYIDQGGETAYKYRTFTPSHANQYNSEGVLQSSKVYEATVSASLGPNDELITLTSAINSPQTLNRFDAQGSLIWSVDLESRTYGNIEHYPLRYDTITSDFNNVFLSGFYALIEFAYGHHGAVHSANDGSTLNEFLGGGTIFSILNDRLIVSDYLPYTEFGRLPVNISAFSIDTQEIVWTKEFSNKFAVHASTQDTFGNYYFTGTEYGVMHVTKLDQDGNTLWTKYFGNNFPFPATIHVSSQGSVYVGGKYRGTYVHPNFIAGDGFLMKILAMPTENQDKIAPEISLNGSKVEYLLLGETYEEQGATGTDDIDGNVEVIINGTVDTTTLGVYLLTYIAKDKAGNSSITNRTIFVTDTGNQPPTADAGQDITFTHGNSEILDASESNDADGSIENYLWKEGSTVLGTMQNLSLENLSVGTHEINLTVTDNLGLEATDTVLVTIEPGEYGIEKTNLEVVNDGVYNGYLFEVRLTAQPSHNVQITLNSSDINQGTLVGADESGNLTLTFTPWNWNQYQQVRIELVYLDDPEYIDDRRFDFIINSTSSESSDGNYNGLIVNNIEIKPLDLSLVLSTPTQTDYVAGVYQWQLLDYSYNGRSAISFSLENAPEGMELNGSRLSWTAPEIAEALTYDIVLIAKTDTLSEQIQFSVTVATTVSVEKQITGNKLTLVDNDCSFNKGAWGDFSVTSNTTDTDKLNSSTFRKVTSEVDYHIPEDLNRTSCLFRADVEAQDDTNSEYTFTLPINLNHLPKDYPIDYIKLYVFESLEPFDETLDKNAWQIASVSVDVVQNESGIYLEFEMDDLQNGLYFIGFEDTDISSTNLQIAQRTLSSANIQARDAIGKCEDYSSYRYDQDSNVLVSFENNNKIICREFDSNGNLYLEVVVLNFGFNPTRWDDISVEDLFQIMLDTATVSESLGLSMRKYILIQIEDRKSGDPGSMNGDVMRLTKDDPAFNETMRATIAHEYFHGFQTKTLKVRKRAEYNNENSTLRKNLMSNERDWIFEGQARWFEDYLDNNILYNSYTTLNSYISTEREGSPILQSGLSGKNDNGYQRFTFYKLLEKKCDLFLKGDTLAPRYLIRDGILSLANEGFGVDDLHQSLLSNKYKCNFGTAFGNEISTRGNLRTALLYYQYATQFIVGGDINLLDKEENEPDDFKFNLAVDIGNILLSNDDFWKEGSNVPYELKLGPIQLPRASANSFSLFLHSSLPRIIPEDKLMTLEVSSPSPVTLSILSDDPLLNSNSVIDNTSSTNHKWITVGDTTTEYHFKSGELVPKSLISLINDDPKNYIENINATVRIRTRKIAEEKELFTTSNCAPGDLFRWGGNLMPDVLPWAKVKFPLLENDIAQCVGTIPDFNIPVDSCVVGTPEFERLVDEYPKATLNKILDCTDSEIKKLFPSAPSPLVPTYITKEIDNFTRHVYWLDESFQQ